MQLLIAQGFIFGLMQTNLESKAALDLVLRLTKKMENLAPGTVAQLRREINQERSVLDPKTNHEALEVLYILEQHLTSLQTIDSSQPVFSENSETKNADEMARVLDANREIIQEINAVKEAYQAKKETKSSLRKITFPVVLILLLVLTAGGIALVYWVVNYLNAMQ